MSEGAAYNGYLKSMKLFRKEGEKEATGENISAAPLKPR